MKHSFLQKLVLLPLVALTFSAATLTAQPADMAPPPEGHGGADGPGRQGKGGKRGGPGESARRPMPSPLVFALDADHDGELSAGELNNAVAALKTLDKNNDGKLTREELHPRPPHDRQSRRGPQTPPPEAPGAPAPAPAPAQPQLPARA